MKKNYSLYTLQLNSLLESMRIRNKEHQGIEEEDKGPLLPPVHQKPLPNTAWGGSYAEMVARMLNKIASPIRRKSYQMSAALLNDVNFKAFKNHIIFSNLICDILDDGKLNKARPKYGTNDLHTYLMGMVLLNAFALNHLKAGETIQQNKDIVMINEVLEPVIRMFDIEGFLAEAIEKKEVGDFDLVIKDFDILKEIYNINPEEDAVAE